MNVLRHGRRGYRAALSFTAAAVLFTALLVFALVLFAVVYSEVHLPRGIDARQFWEAEGPAFDTLDISLITSQREERQGRRVVVLNSGWAFITRTSFADEARPINVIPVSQSFKSDFASIPFPASRIINPFGRHAEAAVIHDWLYALGGAGKMSEKDREFADLVFYDAMRRLNVGWLRRRVMYAAVRLGGRRAFGRGDWAESFFEPLTAQELREDCIIDAPDTVFPVMTKRTRLLYGALAFFGPDEKKERTQIQGEIFRLALSEFGRNYFNEHWREVYERPDCKEFLVQGARARFELEVGAVQKAIEEKTPRVFRPMMFPGERREQLREYVLRRHSGWRIVEEAIVEAIDDMPERQGPG